MADNSISRVDDHTLDTLLSELISGRGLIDSRGKNFTPLPRDSRCILEWFRGNRQIWDGQNRSEYINQMLGALKNDPPVTPPISLPSSDQPFPRYRVSRVRASRFGGLHDFGEPKLAPDTFEIDFKTDQYNSAIIYGRNGCGKSSLLSAICWCLTGWFYRPQGVPEAFGNIVNYYIADPASQEASTAAKIKATPVIPMPSATVLAALAKEKSPVETWVEVELIDDDGVPHGTFRRTATLQNGKVFETPPSGLAALRISPADFEVGTRLSAMLAHIRLDEKSGLGEAVSRLVDIKPLSDVARQAEASILKLKKEVKTSSDQRSALRSKIRADSARLRAEISRLGVSGVSSEQLDSLSDPSPVDIQLIKEAVEASRGSRLSHAQLLLNATVDFSDPAIQRQFISDVTLASDQLTSEALGRLDHAKAWDALSAVSDAQLHAADILIADVRKDGQELANLYKNPDAARRIQLYAKVASWMREADEHDTSYCPVCGEDLNSQVDSQSGATIRSHLDECLKGSSLKLEQAPTKWAENQLGVLRQQADAALLRDPSACQPLEYAKAVVDSVCASAKFAGVLSPLANTLRSRLGDLATQFSFTAYRDESWLPEEIANIESPLTRQLNTILANVHYARSVRTHDVTRSKIEELLVGSEDSAVQSGELLRDTIRAVKLIAHDSQPLTTLIEQIDLVISDLNRESQLVKAETDLERLNNALSSLALLNKLVVQQVSGLLNILQERREYWLDLIYTPARIERPIIGKADLATDGRLNFEATHNGTGAPAHQVSNASHLRATLVAFWLAYWEHQLKSRGGLRLMLLDDPQELFDEENQQQLARAIADLVAADAQVILTTNKRMFLHDIDWKRARSRRLQIDWRPGSCSVHLLRFREEVEDQLDEFKSKNRDEDAARLSDVVRVFAETRLISLFRHRRPHALGDKPTLMTVVDTIRSLNTGGTRPFSGGPVAKLLQHSGCTPGTQFYSLMNDAHHSTRHLITAGRVSKHLNEIETFMKAVEGACSHCESEKMLSEAELVKRRRSRRISAQPQLTPARAPTTEVPLLSATAAADGNTMAEEVQAEGKFDWASIGSVAIYHIRSSSLGLAAPKFCRVIVAIDDRDIPDSSLVLAVRQDDVLARRLSRAPEQPDIVILHSEDLDPRTRAPVTLELVDDVKILPIIGVIWDFSPVVGRGKGEAVVDSAYDLSKMRISLALPVKGVSAEPLVLSGQTVLLGEEIDWKELDNHVDEAVNIELENGAQYLKSVSETKIDKAGEARVFNPLGGLGDPVIGVYLGASGRDISGRFERVRRIRRMMVVLYESATAPV